MTRADHRQAGFTLIEVVVAVAIVALGMMAVFRVVHDTINNTAHLRDRSFATWIADNQLAEVRLGTELPSVDETEGEVEFANQSWRWQVTVSQTPVSDLRRIDVRVGRATDEEGAFLAEVSGFAGAVVMDTPPSGTLWTGSEGPPGDGNGDGDEDGDGDGQAPPRNQRPGTPGNQTGGEPP
ncbi:MAG: hypothetical protein H6R27_163 [Proteobacteria bacterium]|nr:hypothetical protein [Pseudomonadota bacterium]